MQHFGTENVPSVCWTLDSLSCTSASIEIEQKWDGGIDVDVSRVCMTAFYRVLGRFKEADANAQRLLAVTLQVRGKEHPHTVRVRHCTCSPKISA